MDRNAPPEPTLGALVRRYRERAGLSQEALAELAGITPRTVFNLERDLHAPQPQTLARVADALEVSPTERAALVATRRRSRTPPDSIEPQPEPAPQTRRPLVRAGVVAIAVTGVIAGLVAVRLASRDPGPGTPADPRSTPTGLSGRWIGPGPEFVVEGDELRFAARAWPTNPLDPAVHYVNFTVTWDGPEGGWRSACAAFDVTPGTPDTYECVWRLTPNVPDGPITVSFDVHGEAGALHKAPHGMRRGTVRRATA